MIDRLEQPEHGEGRDKKEIRAATSISSFVGDTGIKVLPGKEWGVHYRNPEKRNEILNAVLSGRLAPDKADITELTPAGISYRLQDTAAIGLDSMVGQVRDTANFYKHFDYRGFLDFLAGLSGRDVDLETATRLFNSIGRSRVQSELLRTLGTTGKNQLKSSLRHETETLTQAGNIGRIESLLELLKARWLAKQGIINPADTAKFEKKAGAEIAALADELDEAYLDYVQKGDTGAKKKLADKVRGSFTEIKKQAQADQLDDFVDDMTKNYDELPPDKQDEINQAFNNYQPPSGDTLPEAKDTQDLSMSEMQDVPEGEKVDPLYTVEPPLTGLYQGQIYGNFNPAQLEWETSFNLQSVTPANAPSEHLMCGKKINGGSTVVIYVPRNYVPVSIPKGLQILKDQNGTYYLRNNGNTPVQYEIGFSRQNFANRTSPTAGERADISNGGLSKATLNFIDSLKGKPDIEKAQAIIHYMKNVLGIGYSTDSQYNRIYKSNPSRYFLEIEKHKQVDCKVAQTYFIALCRLARIPARLVTGHKVDLVEDGKAILHSGTGHAWTEIWDAQNNSWKTIDATPEKEDQDQDKKDQQQGNNAPKEDTDIEAPPKEQKGDAPSPEQVGKKVDDKVEQTQQGQQGQGQGQEQSSSPPDSAKEKMKQMMEKNADQSKSESSESGGDEGQISDKQWDEMNKEMEEMQKKHEEMSQKATELQEKMKKTESFKDLKSLEQELEQSELYDEAKENLEKTLEAKEKEAKEELKKEIEKMMEDGFITQEEAEKLLQELTADDMDSYMKIEQQLEHESALYNEYEGIREEVMPLVDEWFEFFAERLPKIEEVDYDEDVRTRRGRFDRRSISRPRNLLFGQTQNPPVISRSIMPRFMSSLVIDISGSMEQRMRDARKLLIFFSELFDRISEKFGYIKFSISAFDTAVELIKDFDYEYGSPTRYDFGGSKKTVKVRLMEMTMARGGTDMGKAVWDANKRLNDEKSDHPDYLSALYTISDGETSGELAGENLKRFLDGQQSFWEEWWGEHMKCGFMLGPESQKAVLAQYFGEDNSEAVPDIRDLIEKVMTRFDEDVQGFIDNLPVV